MTEQELKKLSRKQLLELLLREAERVEELEAQIELLQQKLDDKNVGVTQAGSIAEAALKLNGVFEAAQAAADQYLENIKRLHNDELAKVQERESKICKKKKRSRSRKQS